MSESSENPTEKPASAQPPATPPLPLTVEEWLAAAPKPEDADVSAKEEHSAGDDADFVPIASELSEPPAVADVPDSAAEDPTPIDPNFAGQPVDVVPIIGMTPITEQERVQEVEGGAEDFVPSDSPEPLAIAPAARAHSPIVEAEPSPRELSEMSAEPRTPVPVIPIPAGEAEAGDADVGIDVPPDQTSTEVFVHAHEDVEARRGALSEGYITKFAGVIGLLGCTAGLAVLLTACAGKKTLFNFPVLGAGYWIMWAGVAGIVVALLGGFIEHRRLREETHVLGALFSNALAAIGGLLLWLVATGVPIFPGPGNAGG